MRSDESDQANDAAVLRPWVPAAEVKMAVEDPAVTSAAGTQGLSTAASFAWSDWSDLTDHAADQDGASTSDWTGDYLIKTLPTTIGTRSVSINT